MTFFLKINIPKPRVIEMCTLLISDQFSLSAHLIKPPPTHTPFSKLSVIPYTFHRLRHDQIGQSNVTMKELFVLGHGTMTRFCSSYREQLYKYRLVGGVLKQILRAE